MAGVSQEAFSFDITFRHGEQDPATISAALEMEPSFSWAAGQRSSVGVHKHMRWEGTLAQGSGQDDFDKALRAITAMLEKHRRFLAELIASGGEVEITGNFHLDHSTISAANGDSDGRTGFNVFEMALYPDFIAAVSAVPASLRLQIWG